jgi:lysophospholipase L1-like esterase
MCPRSPRVFVVLLLTACAPIEGDEDGPWLELEDPAPPADPGFTLPFDEGKADGATACRAVAHIGDSLTAGVKPALEREYRRVGVESVTISAYGGRGIAQKVRNDPETGRAAAERIAATGFAGCWVVALGTNDVGNIAAGASYTRESLIDRMMRAIDASGQTRVMWVNAITTRRDGYFANANMQRWNTALVAARRRWPALAVFDWATIAARDEVPFADGIHHTGTGYGARNRAIADALRTAFPR